MSRFAAVLFDLDGTIIDSIGLILESYRHTFARFGVACPGDAALIAGIGKPLEITMAPFAKDDAERLAMVASYREYNYALHDERITGYAGVAEAVRAFAEAGVKLALVTSKNRMGSRRGLRVAGLEGVIDHIVASEDVTRPKPDRQPVDLALALVGEPAERALFVGDSPHDMTSGKAAGVETGAALWGPFTREDLAHTEPTHWLASIDDLARLVLD